MEYPKLYLAQLILTTEFQKVTKMCGITGVWYFNQNENVNPLLQQITESISHRGPDGYGYYIDDQEAFGLGHRRLAILDLSERGKQPLSYGDNRYWISFNGEIYNFLEIRHELSALGYQFKTETDTEVILAAYIHWGDKCQTKFNGMWSFAIWDRVEKQLFLSRDRFGVKPLYFYIDKEKFVFASELKAFLYLPTVQFDNAYIANSIRSEISLEAQRDTFWDNVKKLRSGYCMYICRDSIKEHRWWKTVDHLVTVPESFQDQLEIFRDLLIDACRIRMRSDVPLGVSLSGGVDSSTVLCCLHQLAKDNKLQFIDRVNTNWNTAFIATFDDNLRDESIYALETAQYTSSEPILVSADPSDTDDSFVEILYSFETMTGFPYAAWTVYKEMKSKNIKVSLEGHGGDELMAGYVIHAKAGIVSSLLDPIRMNELYNTYCGMAFRPNSLFEIFDEFQSKIDQAESVDTLFRDLVRIRPDRVIHNFRHLEWLKSTPFPSPSDDFEEDLKKYTDYDLINNLLYYDFHFGKLPGVLKTHDSMSMAHGIEVRSPLMDWRIVTFMFSMKNSSSKIGRGYSKLLLREAMKGYMPESVRQRKTKIGFVGKVRDVFKAAGHQRILDLVHSRSFLESNIWDGHKVRDIVVDIYNNPSKQALFPVWKCVQAGLMQDMFSSTR